MEPSKPPPPPPVCLYLEPGADGTYTVTSPDIPGMVTQGRTADEITRNVQVAAESLMAIWAQLGMEIPPASRVLFMEQVE